MTVLIIDALGSERGVRRFTRDVIGAGPRMVAGILAKFDIPSNIMTAEQFLDPKTTQISADHLFVSAMTMDYVVVKRISQKWATISTLKPETSIKVLGGPITGAGSAILSNLHYDINILGEAEVTLSELIGYNIYQVGLRNRILENVKGIAFKSPHGMIINPLRPFLTRDQLNSYHSSTKHIIDYPHFRAARIFVECVRGCSNFLRPKIQLPDGRICNDCGSCHHPNLESRIACPLGIPPGCGYCSVPALYGPPRSRPVFDILREIEELIGYGATRFNLGASDFLDFQRDALVAPKPLTDPRSPPANYEEIKNLLVGLTELVPKQEVHFFIENIKASLCTDEIMALIAQYLPNTVLSIGAETGSQIHSRLLGRSSTPDEVKNATRLAKKHNLRVHTYFIHGLPGQTLQTAIETRRFMQNLAQIGVEKITIYKFRPLPMTAFAEAKQSRSATDDKASKLIVDTAIEINRAKKVELIGTEEWVMISELARGSPTKAIGYPLRGGPTILVDAAANYLNKKVKVKIDKVLSDKLVGAHLLPEDQPKKIR